MKKVLTSRFGISICMIAYQLVLIGLSYLSSVIFHWNIDGITWTEYVMSYITSPTIVQIILMIAWVATSIIGTEIIYREFKRAENT